MQSTHEKIRVESFFEKKRNTLIPKWSVWYSYSGCSIWDGFGHLYELYDFLIWIHHLSCMLIKIFYRGYWVSLTFGQRPKALCLTRLRRPRERIGGLYLPLLQAGARERFVFVVAEERLQFKLIFLMMKFIPRNIIKFNILTLKTWGWCLSEGRWFSGVVFPPSRYPPCGWARNRCQQSARHSLSVVGSAKHGQGYSVAQNRWLRSSKIQSRAWHRQRFAVGQNLGDIGRSSGRASLWAMFP